MSAISISNKLKFILRPRRRSKKATTTYALLWLLLAFVMLGLNFLPNNFIDSFSASSDNAPSKYRKITKPVKIERYNEKIAQKFQSVDNLVLYIQMYAKDTSDKYEIIEHASKLLRQRFVHAYAVYGMQENWIAAVAGKLIWGDLSAKVIPDDIMNNDAAACSQISIVLMELCRKMGIPTRKVGLVGHYTVETYVNGKWFFHDPDLKPNFKAINGRKSLEEIIKNNEQFALYANTLLDSAAIALKFSNIEYGPINASPAPRAHFFHIVTKEVSHWGWIIPMSISFGLFRKRKSLLS